MDLQRIIRDGEAATAAREEAMRQEREAKAAGEKAFPEMSVAKLQEKLLTVVKPVLEEGQRQIASLGYGCLIHVNRT